VYVIVAGGGKVGFYLAQELLNGNHEVLVIERESARASAIADELGENVLHGDSCEATTLDTAGVSRADLVAAVTGDDEDNLVICEIARKRGVPRTIARINNPKNELLFKKRGIETTISATQAVPPRSSRSCPRTR
jgi:trk system potassium uptake protein TrkA